LGTNVPGWLFVALCGLLRPPARFMRDFEDHSAPDREELARLLIDKTVKGQGVNSGALPLQMESGRKRSHGRPSTQRRLDT
jgi:hypothetical protein